MPKQFISAFVMEPSHDFSQLTKYADRVVFVTTGTEDLWDLPAVIRLTMNEFNPMTDVLIPAGKTAWAFMGGILFGQLNLKEFTMGVYRDNDYRFHKIKIG